MLEVVVGVELPVVGVEGGGAGAALDSLLAGVDCLEPSAAASVELEEGSGALLTVEDELSTGVADMIASSEPVGGSCLICPSFVFSSSSLTV
jgi:hypothetical protein